MALYSTGTVSIAQNATALAGSGTAWLTSGVVQAGWFIPLGAPAQWYQVQNVNSDTSITLASNYEGATLSAVNYVASSVVAANLAAASVVLTPSKPAAVARTVNDKLDGVWDIADFGGVDDATGTGGSIAGTDNWNALALAVASLAPGSVLRFPIRGTGRYLFGAGVTTGAAIASITFSGNTATLTTTTPHGLATGSLVTTSGAAPSAYNVTNASITATSIYSFTYTMGSTPASNATTLGAWTTQYLPPNFGLLQIEAAENVQFCTYIPPSTLLNMRCVRPVTWYIYSGDYYYDTTANWRSHPADKTIFLNGGDVVSQVNSYIDATSATLTHTKALISNLDTIASATPSATTIDTVTWSGRTNDGYIYRSLIAAQPGDEICAQFSLNNAGSVSFNAGAPDTNDRYVIVQCSGGVQMLKISSTSLAISSITFSGTTATLTTSTPHGLSSGNRVTLSGQTPAAYSGTFLITVTGANTFTYTMGSNPGANASVVGAMTHGGSVTNTTKATGGSAGTNSVAAWQSMSALDSYKGAYAALGIRVINATQWTLTVNGVDVFYGGFSTSSIGFIQSVGFGVAGTTATATNCAVFGWTKKSGGIFGGTQALTMGVIGDSRSADFHGGWPYHCRDALEFSFGIRCVGVNNLAIPGMTSGQQLSVLQAQGVGAATIFFIGLGTNDAQAGVTVGWVGTAGSYIDNLYQIVSYITSHVYNPKIVLIMPEMWYTQVNTPSKTSGLATANAEYATPYRLALERYAAFAGIPLVHNPMLLGTLDPSYLNLGINQVDAVVRDNIHASGGAYRAIGMQAARAMMSLLVQNADKSLAYQPVPSGWMAASWVSGAAIYRTKDGHTKLYGTATPGTTTAGTTFMNIPSNFAPPTYMRFPCMTDNNLTAYIVVAPTGAVTLQSWPSGATYLSLDCLDWYSTTS